MDNKKRNSYNAQWQKETKDRINMAFPRGFKDRLQAAADEVGESMTQYVVNAVDMRINAATIPASIPAPPVKAPRDISHLPQPPDTIPSDDMNAQIIWRVDHGWTEEELQIFLSQN